MGFMRRGDGSPLNVTPYSSAGFFLGASRVRNQPIGSPFQVTLGESGFSWRCNVLATHRINSMLEMLSPNRWFDVTTPSVTCVLPDFQEPPSPQPWLWIWDEGIRRGRPAHLQHLCGGEALRGAEEKAAVGQGGKVATTPCSLGSLSPLCRMPCLPKPCWLVKHPYVG